MKWWNIVFIILILCTLTSCWDNQDLIDLAIVSGIALDKTDDHNIEITIQIIKPSAIKSEQSQSDNKEAYVTVSSEGATVLEAMRNLTSKINRKSFFAHVQLIVISEEVAQHSISEMIDFFERDNQTRRRSEVLIAKGIKAKTVLDIESKLEKIPAVHIVESLETSDELSKTRKMNLLDILKHLNHQGHAIVIPTINRFDESDSVHQKDIEIEGLAIIKKDKLVGYLSPTETRGFMFADNSLKNTIIVTPSPLNKKKLVSIEVIRSEGKIEAKMEDNLPIFTIEVKAEGKIAAQQEHSDLTKPAQTEDLEEKVEKIIKEEIEEVVKVTQNKYKSDIFGFTDIMYRNYHPQWKKLVLNWDEVYSNTPVVVNVDFDIRWSGLIRQPTEPK